MPNSGNLKSFTGGTMHLRGSDVARFGILVGFSAIFIDASIAHGLFWENDPYWTYWITKTFLITTVFTIGTAFLGVGITRGLVITAVHTLILEIYYQWFAPVGLPQEPEWLDFNHSRVDSSRLLSGCGSRHVSLDAELQVPRRLFSSSCCPRQLTPTMGFLLLRLPPATP
jgi:hypothetical protein